MKKTMIQAAREMRPIVLTTMTYLAVAVIYSLTSSNHEFLYYIAVILFIGFFILRLRIHVSIGMSVLWALCLWGLLHMMGGLVPIPDGYPVDGKNVLYSLWLIPDYLKYDHVIHIYGFGVATVVCWQCITAFYGTTHHLLGTIVICGLASMGLGALNEVVEFFATLIIPNTNVGGYDNTGWDLVSNAVGTIIAGTGIFFRELKLRSSLP